MEEEKELGETLIPDESPGFVHSHTNRMIFAHTQKELSVGMCGGPVLSGESCVGLLTAKVQTPGADDHLTLEQRALRHELKDKAVFVPTSILNSLIAQSSQDESNVSSDENVANEGDFKM